MSSLTTMAAGYVDFTLWRNSMASDFVLKSPATTLKNGFW